MLNRWYFDDLITRAAFFLNEQRSRKLLVMDSGAGRIFLGCCGENQRRNF